LAYEQPRTAEKEQKMAAEAVVAQNNLFALDLYGKLRAREGNLFFSPYSISTALAMTYAGARGRTDTQMATVLHFPTAPSETVPAMKTLTRMQFHSAFGTIVKDLNTRGKKGGYELTVANALWGQKGYGFLEEFLQLVKANYDGQLNEVDFVKAAESARKTINAWVEKKTKNKIKDLIGRGALDKMTRLVLTNAIYFKGNWDRQFKEDRTMDAPFTLLSGDKVDVPMMNQKAEFRYMETEDIQALELPYVDDELSMVILLPKEPDGLPEFEKELTIETLSAWLSKLRKREVIVSVPKFKMTRQFSLASILKSMGITDAFSPGSADFSGMNGNKDLFISAVIHKAYVDVNEEGTEAAAATAVTMKLTSIGPTPIPVFRADHPFLFLIRDNLLGSILFIGRAANPSA
jgi:serpin B